MLVCWSVLASLLVISLDVLLDSIVVLDSVLVCILVFLDYNYCYNYCYCYNHSEELVSIQEPLYNNDHYASLLGAFRLVS